MPRKGKRRREARRERHEQAARAAAGEPGAEGRVPSSPAELPRRKEKPRPKQRPPRAGYVRVIGWDIAVGTLVGSSVSAVVLALIGVGVYLILSSGSSGVSAPPGATRTPDPRLAGQTPTASFTVEALGAETGSTFSPDRLTAKAGEAFEIVVKNTGTVSHTLRVSGVNKQYEVDQLSGSDDWVVDPYAIKAGEEGRLVVKIDQPGSYPFQCDFHWQTQKGILVLEQGEPSPPPLSRRAGEGR